jgi:hypothetical protein
MRRRDALGALAALSGPVMADASGPRLASYYERHLALAGGVAWVWDGVERAAASPQAGADLVAAGVGRTRCLALRRGGDLVAWTGAAAPAVLMRGVAAFAAGDSGWFAIDTAGTLHHAAGDGTPARIAEGVAAACIGDGCDYFIARDGTLHAKCLAHRGQYGDGRLQATPGFAPVARDAVAVRAHTGHAVYLARDGTVFGTGGNRFGPLGAHGLGDKADRWGAIFQGATAIATGSRHTAALRADGSLWVWGEGFAIEPRKVHDGIAEVACGDTATVALATDGTLLQWERGQGPRRVVLSPRA